MLALRASLAALLVAMAVVLTPLLAGGWRLAALPGWAGLIACAWIALVIARRREGRTLTVPLLSLGLGALAFLTALQALPLGSALGWLSPRAFEVRSFVAPDGRMAVSYEVGATFREAAKLLAYALAAAVAHEVARRRTARRMLLPVVIAGVVSVLAAFMHRTLGLDAMWGVFTAQRSAAELVTTFFNPNHTGAFLVLTGLVAGGLGVEAPNRGARLAYVTVAVWLIGASVLEPSKGGVVALGVGLLLFGFFLWRRGRTESPIGAPMLFAVLLLPLIGVILQLDAVVQEFGLGPEAAYLGLSEKLAAVEGAWTLVAQHPLTGIGRGAYITAYPASQGSNLQLTFAFPENLVAQFTTEWGLGLGTVAFVGLLVAVGARLVRAKKAHEIGALAGVASVVVHDLVDFSLEMPGVAVPCAVILGALTPGRHQRTERSRGWKLVLSGQLQPTLLTLRGSPLVAAAAVAPVLLGALFSYGAFRHGDLQNDLDWLADHGSAVAAGAAVDDERLREVVRQHPANVLISTQVAYIHEVRSPPRLREAMVAINQALFLGPRYADAHVLAGRLLLRAGHRRQAFGELRRAWRLSDGRTDVMATAHRWARTREELLRATPRTEEGEEDPDPKALLRLGTYLLSAGDLARAEEVLDALPEVDALAPEQLEPLVRLALALGRTDRALAAGRRGAELRPGDPIMTVTLARLAHRAGQLERARTLVRDVDLDHPAVDPEVVLGFRLDLAVVASDGEEADEVIRLLRRRVPVSRESQTRLALRAARVHLLAGRPDRAVGELDRALDWSPAKLDLRMMRGRALAELGRRGEARVDAEYVLRRDPKHSAARKLLKQLSVSD